MEHPNNTSYYTARATARVARTIYEKRGEAVVLLGWQGDREAPTRATREASPPYNTTEGLAKPVYCPGDPLRSPWSALSVTYPHKPSYFY